MRPQQARQRVLCQSARCPPHQNSGRTNPPSPQTRTRPFDFYVEPQLNREERLSENQGKPPTLNDFEHDMRPRESRTPLIGISHLNIDGRGDAVQNSLSGNYPITCGDPQLRNSNEHSKACVRMYSEIWVKCVIRCNSNCI